MSKKNITVLGIHLWHDSGASIVRNGKVCTAINENKIIELINKYKIDYIISYEKSIHDEKDIIVIEY